MVADFLTLSIAFIVTFTAIPTLIKFAKQASLFTRRNERTSHASDDIPSLGGVGIFLGIMFSVLLMCPNEKFAEIQYLLATQFIIFFLGLKDDIFVLSARTKLAVQLVCALVLVLLSDVKIDSFYGVIGIHGLGEIESVIFTVFCIVGLINAFNLIDGINCNAGLIAISASSFLAVWFAINGFVPYAIISFSIIGAVLGFLYYNKTPAKIFMGDTGSLLLGLTITFLIIKFIRLNHTVDGLSFSLRSAPSVAVALLFIPIIDTLQVFIIRIKNGNSPFRPDKNHLHHILLRAGFSHHKASLTLFIINTVSIIGAVAFNHYTGKIVIPVLFLIGYTLISILGFGFVKKRRCISE